MDSKEILNYIKKLLNSDYKGIEDSQREVLINSLLNQLNQIQIQKIQINHSSKINEYLNSFKTAQDIIGDFELHLEKQQNKVNKWICRLYPKNTVYPIKIYTNKTIDIIHNSNDVRVGKRIEIVFNERIFQAYSKHSEFFEQYNLVPMTKESNHPFKDVVRVRFDDPKEIITILDIIVESVDWRMYG